MRERSRFAVAVKIIESQADSELVVGRLAVDVAVVALANRKLGDIGITIIRIPQA